MLYKQIPPDSRFRGNDGFWGVFGQTGKRESSFLYIIDLEIPAFAGMTALGRFRTDWQAGIQLFVYYRLRDSRFRGNDGFWGILLIVGQAQCSVPTIGKL